MSAIKLSSPATRGFWEIPVLYEDAQLLALDKPAGIPAVPDPGNAEQPDLMSLLHAGIKEGKPWALERGLSFLAPVHRLDPDLGGLMLLVKDKAVLAPLGDLFGSEKPVQRYVALVQGEPDEDKFEVNAKLAPHPVRPGQFHVDAKRGKRARTQCAVLERFSGWTLLGCYALTNRQHQVRVHLRYVRLPVAGDEVYGGPRLLLSNLKPGYHLKPNRTERPLTPGAALYSEQLAFAHPVTGADLTISAPPPKDVAVALKYLRRYGAVTRPTP